MSRTLAHLISSHTLSKVTPEKLVSALGLSLSSVAGDEGSKQAPLSAKDALSSLGIDLSELHSSAYDRYVKASRLAARYFGVKGGETGVVVNGRVRLFFYPSRGLAS